METVKAKVREFLRGYIADHEFADDEDIFASGYANSLFVMQLIYMVEREFQITVGDEDLEFDNFRSIDAVARLVTAKSAVPAGT
ncbi:acyl carrier protein [Spongiactinospora rosea]|uniref:D-alanyl carrier protein n=2 Tax=Spongiactinospora TaxID=2871671 RepID=A0A2W2GY38_9ACTN|nr:MULTISPECIES: phosphopantetheine-binding protein [Spongiactinospora]PZG47439.1 D-alanyl carrier protein [Spongiactinospora gelatinilytica]RBQ20930.1 acyl carrier protein [Spongiactinospora rosea]